MIAPFQVLAFDPGGSTGWAYDWWDGSEHHFDGGTFNYADHHQAIRDCIVFFHKRNLIPPDKMAVPHGPLYVVTESFDYRQSAAKDRGKTGLELISRDYIGVMQLVCQDLNLQLFRQKPSERTWCNDKKLDQLGLLALPIHDNRHMHDAYRHLITFLVRTLKHTQGITEHFKTGPLHESNDV